MPRYDAGRHPYCFGLSFARGRDVCRERCVHGLSGTGECPLTYQVKQDGLNRTGMTHISTLMNQISWRLPG